MICTQRVGVTFARALRVGSLRCIPLVAAGMHLRVVGMVGWA